MKKTNFLFVFAALAALTLLSGCRGRDGRDGLDGVITNRVIIDLEADNSNWVNDNGAYYATFDVPELTRDAYNNGMVNCYVEFNTGTANAYQELMPFIYFDQYVDQTTGVAQNWSRLLDYDYTIGSLTVYYTNNDFDYVTTGTNPEPGLWHFRLVIIW